MACEKLKYSREGLWVRKEGDIYRVGLSLQGSVEVGEVTFVDLPSKGVMNEGDPLMNVETSKAANEFPSPFPGSVIEVNDALLDHPEYLKSNDKERNWIAVIHQLSESKYVALKDEKPEFILSHTVRI